MCAASCLQLCSAHSAEQSFLLPERAAPASKSHRHQQDLGWLDSFDSKKEKQSGNRKFPPNLQYYYIDGTVSVWRSGLANKIGGRGGTLLPSLPQTAAAPRMDERRRRPREPAELERVFPLAEVGEACHAGGAGGGGGGRQAWASNAAPNTLGEAAAQATSERTWEAEGLATRAQTRLLLRSAQVRGG